VLKQKLAASDANSNDTFGACVAISGNSVAVGAPFHGGNAGAVYVFNRAAGNFSQTNTLTTDGGALHSAFLGFSVAIGNGTVVAGAPAYEQFTPTPAGAAFLFDLQP
jgi:hypothetical protein